MVLRFVGLGVICVVVGFVGRRISQSMLEESKAKGQKFLSGEEKLETHMAIREDLDD